jgi:aspartate aminotransferase
MLSSRMQRIGLSPTLRIAARAKKMAAEGIDVVDLSAGEPDFPTPDPVVRAAKEALDQGWTKYVPSDGIPELRQAICDKVAEESGVAWAPENVLVSPGAKNALFNVTAALLSEGDEAIVPAPYWVSYPDQTALAGATPVVVPTREEDGFRLQADALAEAITPRTKLLFLNYPSNPTGACYGREELEAIAEVCLRHRLWILADEIYRNLVFSGSSFVSVASLSPEVAARSIVVDGFSKTYAMTGWRLGWAAGPREVIEACSRVQSHNTSGAASFVQKAAVTALRECDPDVERMRAEFERRRDVMVGGLRRIPGVTCTVPEGAFYAFPNVGRYLGRYVGDTPIHSGTELAAYLLEEAQVAVVPGEAFGAEPYLRLSFAASLPRIEEGLARMAEALARQD